MNQRSAGFMLEKYLDNLTNYAETVCDPFLDGSGGSTPTSRPGSSGEDALGNQYPNAVPQEFYEPILGESSVSMMTPSPAGKFQIENDEEGTHCNMQEHEDWLAGFEELTGGDGLAHGMSSANLEPPPDIEEPADDDILTSVDDKIFTRESVGTEGMENLRFAHLQINVDQARSLDHLNSTRANLSPPSSAQCKKFPKKPSFMFTVSVRVSGSPVWMRRYILIDGQGYLTISPHTAPTLNTNSFPNNDSPAMEKWKVFSMAGRTELFHISEFRIRLPSPQGFMSTLQEKVVLDHLICGELQIRVVTSDNHRSLLEGCKLAHKPPYPF